MDHMPLCGFGTYCLKKDDAYKSTLCALQNGYRHVDTATLYGNEKEVGLALKDSSVTREHIWLTTKIKVNDIEKGKDAMVQSVFNSLDQLGTYIDLILLHGPTDQIKESWAILEEIMLSFEHKVRYIGVSNYNIDHLNIILSNCTIKPYANQFEVSPYLNKSELINFCKDNGIVVVAHTSLTKGRKLNDPKLDNISIRTNISKPLLLLAWALHYNMVVLPRSSNEDHIEENLKCLDIKLDDDCVRKLDEFYVNDKFCMYHKFC